MEMNAFNPVIKHIDENWSLKCIIFISSFEIHWGSGLIFYPITSRLYFLLPVRQLCRLWLLVTAGRSAGHICQWLHQSLLSSQSIILLIIFSSFTPALLQASLSPCHSCLHSWSFPRTSLWLGFLTVIPFFLCHFSQLYYNPEISSSQPRWLFASYLFNWLLIGSVF